MEWLVLIDKKTGILFTVTRELREKYLSVMFLNSCVVDSRVIKVCETKEEAVKYIDEIDDVDDLLNELL